MSKKNRNMKRILKRLNWDYIIMLLIAIALLIFTIYSGFDSMPSMIRNILVYIGGMLSGIIAYQLKYD